MASISPKKVELFLEVWNLLRTTPEDPAASKLLPLSARLFLSRRRTSLTEPTSSSGSASFGFFVCSDLGPQHSFGLFDRFGLLLYARLAESSKDSA